MVYSTQLRKAKTVTPVVIPAKKKIPEKIEEEILEPMDYLIDLILGLEVESDLEKTLLAKFHEPKVYLIIETLC